MRTPSRVTHPEDEFRFYTEAARDGILYIRSLNDEPVLAGARGQLRLVREHMGPNTNPAWIVGQCAEEAYNRGLIDKQELDWLAR